MHLAPLSGDMTFNHSLLPWCSWGIWPRFDMAAAKRVAFLCLRLRPVLNIRLLGWSRPKEAGACFCLLTSTVGRVSLQCAPCRFFPSAPPKTGGSWIVRWGQAMSTCSALDGLKMVLTVRHGPSIGDRQASSNLDLRSQRHARSRTTYWLPCNRISRIRLRRRHLQTSLREREWMMGSNTWRVSRITLRHLRNIHSLWYRSLAASPTNSNEELLNNPQQDTLRALIHPMGLTLPDALTRMPAQAAPCHDLHYKHTARRGDTTCVTSGAKVVAVVIFVLLHRLKPVVTQSPRGILSVLDTASEVRLTPAIPQDTDVSASFVRSLTTLFHHHQASQAQRALGDRTQSRPLLRARPFIPRLTLTPGRSWSRLSKDGKVDLPRFRFRFRDGAYRDRVFLTCAYPSGSGKPLILLVRLQRTPLPFI